MRARVAVAAAAGVLAGGVLAAAFRLGVRVGRRRAVRDALDVLLGA